MATEFDVTFTIDDPFVVTFNTDELFTVTLNEVDAFDVNYASDSFAVNFTEGEVISSPTEFEVSFEEVVPFSTTFDPDVNFQTEFDADVGFSVSLTQEDFSVTFAEQGFQGPAGTGGTGLSDDCTLPPTTGPDVLCVEINGVEHYINSLVARTPNFAARLTGVPGTTSVFTQTEDATLTAVATVGTVNSIIAATIARVDPRLSASLPRDGVTARIPAAIYRQAGDYSVRVAVSGNNADNVRQSVTLTGAWTRFVPNYWRTAPAGTGATIASRADAGTEFDLMNNSSFTATGTAGNRIFFTTEMTNPQIASDADFRFPVVAVQRNTFTDTDVAGIEHTYRVFEIGTIDATGRSTIFTRE